MVRTNKNPPMRVVVWAAVLLLWLILAAWLGYTTGVYEVMIFGVCTVFAVVALGLPALMLWIGRRRPGPRPSRAPGWSDTEDVETQAGRLGARQAAVQILLVPGSLALGFSAIALVELLVR